LLWDLRKSRSASQRPPALISIFVRRLIDENRIAEDVTIQVLTQAREDLIRRTFESIRGCRRAIVHLYNSTSELQRRVVFGLDRTGITKLATDGTPLIRDLAKDVAVEHKISFEFAGKPLGPNNYAKEICRSRHGRVSPHTLEQVDP
jgi:2-isopropylmalate synthase